MVGGPILTSGTMVSGLMVTPSPCEQTDRQRAVKTFRSCEISAGVFTSQEGSQTFGPDLNLSVSAQKLKERTDRHGCLLS